MTGPQSVASRAVRPAEEGGQRVRGQRGGLRADQTRPAGPAGLRASLSVLATAYRRRGAARCPRASQVMERPARPALGRPITPSGGIPSRCAPDLRPARLPSLPRPPPVTAAMTDAGAMARLAPRSPAALGALIARGQSAERAARALRPPGDYLQWHRMTGSDVCPG